MAVVTHSVTVAVEAWTNHHQDIDQAINKVHQISVLKSENRSSPDVEQILEAIHHPYFARGDSAVQNDMIDV